MGYGFILLPKTMGKTLFTINIRGKKAARTITELNAMRASLVMASKFC